MSEEYFIDEDFDYFYNKGFGPAIASEPVSEETLAKYRGRLPDKLLEYWQKVGFSGWGDGRFWIVNPEEYEDVLAAWFANIELPAGEEYFVIARTAFGVLYVWGTIHGRCFAIDAHANNIFPKMKVTPKEKQDSALQIFFSSKTKNGEDYYDDSDKLLFERVLKKLGPVNKNEMYAPNIAPVLGGRCGIRTIVKKPIISHLLYLAELEPPRMMMDIVQHVKDLGLDDKF